MRRVLAEVRDRRVVAALLVVVQRVADRASSGETVVERIDEQLHVAERVTQAERENRILVQSGVADERPSGPYGFRKKFGISVAPLNGSLRRPARTRAASEEWCRSPP